MEQLTYERLQDNLKRLKLFKAVEILDSIADASEASGGSYLAFLDQLLEEEVAATKYTVAVGGDTVICEKGWVPFQV